MKWAGLIHSATPHESPPRGGRGLKSSPPLGGVYVSAVVAPLAGGVD